MSATNQNPKRKSTNQLLKKIPSKPGLYRHEINKTYYGKRKINGKRKEHSLKTTDRTIAERKLKRWIEELEHIDTDSEKMSLRTLLGTFKAIRAGKARKTIQTENSCSKRFEETWSRGLDIRVSDVKQSDVQGWLASQENSWTPTTYNRYALWLRQLFKIAVADRVIAKSPMENLVTWKKPMRKKPKIPTETQFLEILKEVRDQRFNADAEDSADFIEFLGRAGLGQAEASSLTWDDLNFETKHASIVRRKTGTRFHIPMYADLVPLLERLRRKAEENPPKPRKILRISNARKALSGACLRLSFPAFTQRSLRQMKIVALLRSGVNPKTVATWQSHQDGGKLIMDTYSEVLSADDDAFAQKELAKYAKSLNLNI